MSVIQLYPTQLKTSLHPPLPAPARRLPTVDLQALPGAAITNKLVPTIFHERWWLDVVTRGRVQAAEVVQQGRVVGWLPYHVTSRRGFRVSVMPDMTHLLGPAVDEGTGNGKGLRRMDIIRELVGKLPRLALFSQTCHPGTPDILAFQASGFDSFVQFSAEIAPAPEEQLWRGLRDKVRNVIRRAGERGQVEVLADGAEFAHFYRRNLERVGERSYFDLELIAPVHEAASRRDQGRIFAVRNAADALVAAVFFVWDASRLWYLLSTRDSTQPDNGAVSLLVWRGIQEASKRGLLFDFDGIAGEGSARFFAGFGGRVQPRFAVHRSSPVFALARSVSALLRPSHGRNHFTAP